MSHQGDNRTKKKTAKLAIEAPRPVGLVSNAEAMSSLELEPPVHKPPPVTNKHVREQFEKTILCRFSETGCRAGAKCPFAHGSEELRRRPDLTKTSLCQAFREGRCP